MKKPIKIYLHDQDLRHLKLKAEALGFTGRGNLSRYLEKISREELVFLSDDVKKVIGLLSNHKK